MLKPAFADRFEIGVTDERLDEPRAGLAQLDELLNRAPEPPGALCRRQRLRHQGRHPCLGASSRTRRPTSTCRRRRSATAASSWSPTRAARSNLLAELERVGIAVERDDPRLDRLLDVVKEREAIGYAYEGADASFELLARACSARCRIFSMSTRFDVKVERRINAMGERVTVTEAVVKVRSATTSR